MSSDEDDDGEEPVAPPPQYFARAQRTAISAEAFHSSDASAWEAPVFQKSPQERAQLSQIIRTSHDSKIQMMFGSVNAETFEKVLDAMFPKSIAKDEKVIEQGAVGDNFFIVKSGHFDITLKKGADAPKKVFEVGAGFAFGELALLYNAPRAATITATTESEVWCLARDAFRNLVVRSAEAQFRRYVKFLKKCDIFSELNDDQLASLAEVLQEEDFEEDEAVLEQGERDDKMYILQSGEAVACIKGDEGEAEVMQYKSGDFFGEIALLLGEPRKASVYAVSPCTCLYITRDTFRRVLGPLHAILEANIEKYSKYQDMIAESAAQEAGNGVKKETRASRAAADRMEIFEGARQRAPREKNRKRERGRSVVLDGGDDEELDSKPAAEKKPASLKEKIEQDYANPALVAPCAQFDVPSSKLQIFGALRFPEKFTEDKSVAVTTSATRTSDGLEDTYAWSFPTKLEASTSIAVVCQKGQKSADDPTPNQDNYFVKFVNGVSIYGVMDGHGPFGHLVSFRLVQSLPTILMNHPSFGTDWEKAMKESFVEAQRELLAFAEVQNINVEASGAAGSLLVMEEQSVHIAHIGDARVMLASYNRRDSRLIFATEDHKPQLPAERKRLEDAGTEVREVDEGSFRIYRQGTTFPGLTMSRAFGDTACAGVTQEPEYNRFLMQPSDEYYAIVASDGVWEFLEPEDVVGLSAKKLRLKGPRETLQFILSASRKRWAHCCGDYCDDITGILVQWNAKKDGSDSNHSLTLQRHV